MLNGSELILKSCLIQTGVNRSINKSFRNLDGGECQLFDIADPLAS